jgi:hypothetical protein
MKRPTVRTVRTVPVYIPLTPYRPYRTGKVYTYQDNGTVVFSKCVLYGFL